MSSWSGRRPAKISASRAKHLLSFPPEPKPFGAKLWLRPPTARVCDSSGRTGEKLATSETTQDVASLSRHLHTRIAARVCDTRDRAGKKQATSEPTQSTLRNSLPGIGFRWGHCRVSFVSQHTICKQPSANTVSHDTRTHELPPEFVTRATDRRKTSDTGANVARCETVFLVSDSVRGTVRSCLCPDTTLSSNHQRIQSLTTLAHTNCRQRL